MKPSLDQLRIADLDRRFRFSDESTSHQDSPTPPGGWLRTVRQALGFSQTAVARKAGISQQAYAQFESGETGGTLSLGNLRRIARTMDCELVYHLVPRPGKAGSFRELAAQLKADSTPLADPGLTPAARAVAAEDLPQHLR